MSNQSRTSSLPPIGRRPIVERRHLVSALNAVVLPPGFAAPLTLITAPAGFGKTTLVAHWLSQAWPIEPEPAIAWLSLEAQDNDPGRFAARLVTALTELSPANDPPSTTPSEVQPTAAAMRFLAATQNAGPSVLVLDDYHLISSPAIHDAMGFLLDHLPPSVHVVVISRTDPPLSLARRRVRQEMNEVRVADLRFSADEAAAYLNDLMRLELAEDEVGVLERRTEGWIAGLQLAAHSLRLAGDRSAFLADFAGDDRFVADYLLEEVLLRQPAEVQAFLLETSVLNRLHPDLVEAVTQRPGGRALLSELEQANLFLVPLDNRRQWYRYHRLFADLLRRRLAERDRDLRPYHERAARWYAGNGQPDEAIDHALEAGNQVLACDLILSLAPSLFKESRLVTMTRWYGRLSPAELDRRPPLCLGFAWAWLATGHPTEAEECVATLERALGLTAVDLCGESLPLPMQQAAALIEAAAVRSRIAVDRLDVDEGVSLARCALTHVDAVIEAGTPAGSWAASFNTPQSVRPVLLFNLGLAQYLNNNLDEAALALAATAEEATGNGHLIGLSLGHLVGVERLRGRLRLAEATTSHGLRLVEQAYGNLSPMAGLLMAHRGATYYDRGELEAAREWWARAVDLARPWGNWEALAPAYLGLARLALYSGDLPGAMGFLEDLEAHTPTHVEIIGALVESYRHWFMAESGAQLAALAQSRERTLPLLADQIDLCQSRALLATGHGRESLEPLTRVSRSAAATGRYGVLLEAKVLLARAQVAVGQPDQALDTLDQTMALAAGEGVVQPFREAAGAGIARLLEEGLASGRLPAFAASVLGRPHESIPSPGPGRHLTDLGPDAGILETLTERERQVLTLIATGLSNREIGDRLYLTEGTVKNHAHSIYEKLGVSGRTQAIVRGRLLGYLPA